MSDTDNGSACAWCELPSSHKQGRIWLCPKHYRFQQMRVRAKRDGKEVPTYLHLENLASWLNNMRCSHCGVTMNWLAREGSRTVVTLQHDRDVKPVRFRLLCIGCNTRHAQHPNDSYYDVKPGTKRCPMCSEVKPHSHFSIDRSRPCGLVSYCKPCASAKHVAWRMSHATAV